MAHDRPFISPLCFLPGCGYFAFVCLFLVLKKTLFVFVLRVFSSISISNNPGFGFPEESESASWVWVIRNMCIRISKCKMPNATCASGYLNATARARVPPPQTPHAT
jgi:hypothetical protein